MSGPIAGAGPGEYVAAVPGEYSATNTEVSQPFFVWWQQLSKNAKIEELKLTISKVNLDTSTNPGNVLVEFFPICAESVAVPSVEETPTDEEIIEAVEDTTGTDVPTETESAVVTASSNANSPAFALVKLLVMEKAVAKARTTQVYSANKKAMEPLLKDIETQLATLKTIAKGNAKTMVSDLLKAKGAAPKRGMLSRIFSRTGNFFTGMATLITGKQEPIAQGTWRAMENQVKQLKKVSVFAKNRKALAAIDKIVRDIAQLKSIAEGKEASSAQATAQTTAKKTIGAKVTSFFRRK